MECRRCGLTAPDKQWAHGLDKLYCGAVCRRAAHHELRRHQQWLALEMLRVLVGRNDGKPIGMEELQEWPGVDGTAKVMRQVGEWAERVLSRPAGAAGPAARPAAADGPAREGRVATRTD